MNWIKKLRNEKLIKLAALVFLCVSLIFILLNANPPTGKVDPTNVMLGEEEYILYVDKRAEIHFINRTNLEECYIELPLPDPQNEHYITTAVGGKNMIVYCVVRIVNEFASNSDFYLIKWDPTKGYSYTFTRTPVLFTTSGIERTPCISKDGSKIAFGKGNSIHIVETDNALRWGRYAAWEGISLEEWPCYLDFSPDGSQIVYANSNGDIKSVDLATYAVQSICVGGFRTMPTWSPNSPWIIHSMRKDNYSPPTWDLQKKYIGGFVSDLTSTPDYDELRPRFSPDGAHIIYERYDTRGNGEIREIDFNGVTGSIISDRKIVNVNPRPTSDSDWMLLAGEHPLTSTPSYFTCNQFMIFNSIVRGRVGEPLTYRIPVFGGARPYTFILESELPSGLTLYSDGVISGIPTTGGEFTVSIRVIDNLMPPFRGERTGEYQFKIEGPQLKVKVQDQFGESVDIDLNSLIESGTPPYTFDFFDSPPSGFTITGNRLTGTPTQWETEVKLVVRDQSNNVVRPRFKIYKISKIREYYNVITLLETLYDPLSVYVFDSGDDLLEGYSWHVRSASLDIRETPDGHTYEVAIPRTNIVENRITNLRKTDVFQDITTPYETIKGRLTFSYEFTFEQRRYSSGTISSANYGDVLQRYQYIQEVSTPDFLIVRDRKLYDTFRFDNFKTEYLDWNLFRDLFGCGDLYDCICGLGLDCPCCDATLLCCWREPVSEFIYDYFYNSLSRNGNCFGMCTGVYKTRYNSYTRIDVGIPIFTATLEHSINPYRDDPKIWGTLQRYINGMHGWQLDWDVMRVVIDQIDPLYKDIGDWTRGVVNTLRSENPDDYILGITEVAALGAKGHALAPYEVIERDGGLCYWILCYDPNRPLNNDVMANHGSYVEVHPGRDWRFTFDDGTVWQGGYIDLIPKSILIGNASLPGFENLGELVIILLADAQTEQITDESGNTLFDSNGKLITDKPTMDVMFYPVLNANSELSSSMLIMKNKGKYTLRLKPTGEKRSRYTFITNKYSIGIESQGLSNRDGFIRDLDVLTMDYNINELSYFSSIQKKVYFRITKQFPDSLTQLMEIRNVDLNEGIHVKINENGIDLYSPQNSSYDIRLNSSGACYSEFRHDGIKLPKNQSQRLIPSYDFSGLIMRIDNDGDGFYEEAHELQEKFLGPVAKAKNISIPIVSDTMNMIAIQLDASESYSPTGKSLSYMWDIPFHEEITTDQPKMEVQMPIGGWSGKLRVSDGEREDKTEFIIQIGEYMTIVRDKKVDTHISQADLFQNYPNPFNSETTIRYQLPYKTKISLKIYDIMGGLIKVLIDETQPAGEYKIIWDGKDEENRRVPSGIYIVKIETKDFSKALKISLIK